MGFLSRAMSNISTVSSRASKSGSWHPADWPRDGNLERWLITGNSSPTSYTGRAVDEESAMSDTAVWSAVTQLSQSVASLPLHLYKRLDRGKKRMNGDSRYQMMHLKPNPEMTSMDFREAQMGQVLRYGTCYAEKELDVSGNVLALWPLLSTQVRMDRLLGKLVYIVKVPIADNRDPKKVSGSEHILDSSRILKVSGFSNNGLLGYSPVKVGKQSIALSLAIEEYGARFYGNNARPDAVLESPDTIGVDAQERLRKSWEDIHKGLENSHRIAILEQGMKLHEFSSDPQKAQALETRKFQIEEVARIFNMPVHMLKNLDRATNNNIEFQGMEFVIYTLRPWLVKFEQGYTTQLLREKEQKKLFFEHLIDGLMRGDTKTRHAAYAVGRQWGYYSANDVLEIENRNSIGEQGDIYLIPMNMIPADKAEELAESQIDKNEETPDKSEEKSKKVDIKSKFLNIISGRQMTPNDWQEAYVNGKAHWAMDLNPSLFVQEFVEELKNLGVSGKLLEIGCGNGRDSIFLARAGLEVTAIDVAPAAVKMAKENAESVDVVIDFQEANAENLPFEDNTFDALFTLSVLHSSDLNKSIPEVARVLKPDGVMLIYIYGDTQFADDTSEVYITVDGFSTLLKNSGFELLDFYSTEEDEFDDMGEKHQLLVATVRKNKGE